MTDNISELPKRETPSIFGPERSPGNTVVIQGRVIPHMFCRDKGDMVEIIIDERFSYTFPKEWAFLAVQMAAQSMAIGAGFRHMGADTKDRCFAPEIRELKP